MAESVPSPSDPLYIFISYARPQQAIAEQVEAAMRGAGLRIFRDTSDIRSGANWDMTIEKALHEADRMVLLLSSASMPYRKEVHREWFFFDQERKPIYPLYVEDCELHTRLRAYNYIDARDDLRMAINKLLAEINHETILPNNPPEKLVLTTKQLRILMTTAEPGDLLTQYPALDEGLLQFLFSDNRYSTKLHRQRSGLQLYHLFHESRQPGNAAHIWHHTGIADEHGLILVQQDAAARRLSYKDLNDIIQNPSPIPIAFLHLQTNTEPTVLRQALSQLNFRSLICCTSRGIAYQQFATTFYSVVLEGNIQQALQQGKSAFDAANPTTEEATTLFVLT